ncbi:MAG: transporter [Gordonia sp. (in: high G+C Gram-positive bacteria)]
MSDAITLAIVIVLWLGVISLVLWGWRNRGKRQQAQVGEFPVPPADLGEPRIGPHTGLYVGSTLAPSWQNRVAVGDYGDRAETEYIDYPAGILLSRTGASPIWIPREDIVAVRTENGHAGKVMSRDGVLVIRWTLPSGTTLDSGVRGDDKSSYPEWTTAYAEVNEKAFAEFESAAPRSKSGDKKTKKTKGLGTN